MTTRLLSSGEFCKLRYDTIPVKSASANVSFYTDNSKMSYFELWHSCRKRGDMYALRWDLYMYNKTFTRINTPMHLTGFEPTFPASERKQIHALDRAATFIGGMRLITRSSIKLQPCDLIINNLKKWALRTTALTRKYDVRSICFYLSCFMINIEHCVGLYYQDTGI